MPKHQVIIKIKRSSVDFEICSKNFGKIYFESINVKIIETTASINVKIIPVQDLLHQELKKHLLP